MIDLHFHLLPAIDDGPGSDEDMLALARAAAAGGTRTVVATPHVSWEYRNAAADIAQDVARATTVLSAAGIDLTVQRGAEISGTLALELPDAELVQLSLGGGGWLLIECPHIPRAVGFDAVLFELQSRGHRIVLAHPERCPEFHRRPELLERFVRSGMATSVTAGSLVGRFGLRVKRFALGLARDGLVHNVSSDAHDDRRPPDIASALARAGLHTQAEPLTRTVPEAILAGAPLPPMTTAPEPPPRRWRPGSRRSRD